MPQREARRRWSAFSRHQALIQASGDWRNSWGLIFPILYLVRAVSLGILPLAETPAHLIAIAIGVATSVWSYFRPESYLPFRAPLMVALRLAFFGLRPRQVRTARSELRCMPG